MFSELEDDRPARPQPRRGAGAQKAHAHMMMIGILPTLDRGRCSTARCCQRQPALQAAQRADLRRPRRGPASSPSTASSGSRSSPTRSRPRRRARASSCTSSSIPATFGAHWNAAQAIAGHPARGRRQLAVLLRPRAVARDADRAVRAGHRHAPGGAQGPGRAPARVVRRALDHVDLRPVRGERPLLPGAAAGGRGRGPGGGARARRRAAAAGAAPAQRHDLPLEPADLRRRARPPAPARGEPRAAGGPDGRRHARQRRLLLRARARAGRGRPPDLVADVVLGGRGELPRRRAATGIDARLYWPGVGEVPAAELVLRRLLPMAHDGLDRWGVDAADARPPARDHRAPLRRAGATARRGRRPRSTASTSASTAPTRCAR